MSCFHTRASASAAADFGFTIDPIPQTAPAGPFEVWTDGGCRPNPGPGGWAAILRSPDGTEKEISGAEMDTTNNRMELRAAIAALEALPLPSRITLHADSEYVFLGMTQRLQGWIADRWRTAKGKPVLNRDLWERLATAAARHQAEWRWTRGHAGDPMNERVDRLAAAAREKVA